MTVEEARKQFQELRKQGCDVMIYNPIPSTGLCSGPWFEGDSVFRGKSLKGLKVIGTPTPEFEKHRTSFEVVERKTIAQDYPGSLIFDGEWHWLGCSCDICKAEKQESKSNPFSDLNQIRATLEQQGVDFSKDVIEFPVEACNQIFCRPGHPFAGYSIRNLLEAWQHKTGQKFKKTYDTYDYGN